MLGSNCRLLGTNSQPRAHCQSWVQHNLAIQVAPLIIIIFIFPICFQIQTLTASRSAPTLGSKNSTTSPSMQVSHSVVKHSTENTHFFTIHKEQYHHCRDQFDWLDWILPNKKICNNNLYVPRKGTESKPVKLVTSCR